MCQRTTFSVVFFCKRTKVNKKSKAPIYARILDSSILLDMQIVAKKMAL